MSGHSTSPRRPWLSGLSGRVLALTLLVSLLLQCALVGILLTIRWTDSLNERLSSALVAVLAQDAAGDMRVSETLEKDLLRVAGVDTIALKTEEFRQLVLTKEMPKPPTARIDLRTSGFFKRFVEAGATLLRGGEGELQVVGPVQKMPGEFIEILLPETDLYSELWDIFLGGLLAAFVIATAVGGLLFLLLNRLLVRPVQRLTRSMIRFADDPDNPSNTLTAWNRYDEIGAAARSLRDLQMRLRNLLGEKRRLAALGGAVSRINHDLRNLFATMQLVSDTLERVDDPRVQRAAPRLVRALERGIALCETTLEFGRTGDLEVHASRQLLLPIVREAAEQFDLRSDLIGIDVEIAPGLTASFDSDHLFRILSNLMRNALAAMEAVEGRIRLVAAVSGATVAIDISDSGPGIPPQRRDRLFEAFGPSQTKSGSGLGLAISRELARAMGGDLTLKRTGPEGTCFVLTLPAQ